MIRRTACLIAHGIEPYHNQALEKHLMDTLPEETAILYLWQNRHTILLGRGQDPRQVCAEFFAGHVARRLSGGGAVYQDMGCVNFTFILPKHAFDIPRQMGILGMAAGAFGIQLQSASRGELAVEGRTCCICDFFKSGSAAYHHGSIFVYSDEAARARSLNHRQSRSTQDLSALSRDVTVEGLQQALYWAFGRAYGVEAAMLDERMMDQRSIDLAAAHFANRQWIWPAADEYNVLAEERFPWGNVSVRLREENGVIRAAKIFTDAMEAALFAHMEQALVGSPFLVSAISARLGQKLALLRDPRLMQLAGDVSNLICRRIRRR